MLKSIGAFLAMAVVISIYLLVFCIAIFYALVAVYGISVWFGWHGWWVTALVFGMLIFLRNIGFFLILILGAYGAFYGWHWTWWVVVLVFFPGVPFMFTASLLSVISGLFGVLTKGRRTA